MKQWISDVAELLLLDLAITGILLTLSMRCLRHSYDIRITIKNSKTKLTPSSSWF